MNARELEQQIGGFSQHQAGHGEVKPCLGCHHGGWDDLESQALYQKSLLASPELACLLLGNEKSIGSQGFMVQSCPHSC